VIYGKVIDQIGGCITEIATETAKIFIDLGHNLPKGNKPLEDKNANWFNFFCNFAV